MRKNSLTKSGKRFPLHKILLVVENGQVQEILVTSKLLSEASFLVVDFDYFVMKDATKLIREITPVETTEHKILNRFGTLDGVCEIVTRFIRRVWGIAHWSSPLKTPVGIYLGGRKVAEFDSIKSTAAAFGMSARAISNRIETGKAYDGLVFKTKSHEQTEITP